MSMLGGELPGFVNTHQAYTDPCAWCRSVGGRRAAAWHPHSPGSHRMKAAKPSSSSTYASGGASGYSSLMRRTAKSCDGAAGSDCQRPRSRADWVGKGSGFQGRAGLWLAGFVKSKGPRFGGVGGPRVSRSFRVKALLGLEGLGLGPSFAGSGRPRVGRSCRVQALLGLEGLGLVGIAGSKLCWGWKA
eukprot:364321-Chlamydomonas_euryale.AAC.8